MDTEQRFYWFNFEIFGISIFSVYDYVINDGSWGGIAISLITKNNQCFDYFNLELFGMKIFNISNSTQNNQISIKLLGIDIKQNVLKND